MSADSKPDLLRAMGRWSLVALVVNSIIGSGIFGLPSVEAGMLGPASPLAYLPAALGMGVIMACFAEVASRFRQAGGPYLYARVAFGRLAGIEVAWVTWLARLTAAAANVNLFVIYLAEFWPAARSPWPRFAVLSLLVGVLTFVNYRGVRAGARQSNLFAVAKLVPLLLFIAAGLFFIHGGNFSVHSPAPAGTWLEAVLLLVFAFGGFEGAVIPMSEARDPRRDAPFALFSALAAVTLVYLLVQVVVTGVLPDASVSDRPLAAAAHLFVGPAGAAFITLGALISVYGLLSSMTLYTPRLTFALAEQGDFPAPFAWVHPRFRTPYVSIAAFGVLVWGLALAGSFQWNVTLSAVSRLFTYGATCAALVVFRKKPPEKEALHLPAGPAFSLLGILFCLALITRMGRGEFAIVLATGVVGLVNWAWARRRPEPHA
jgi:basic amino acid/polyamine antiporter, APA family